MTLVAQVTPIQGGLPRVEFQWNFDTEILAAAMPGPAGSSEPDGTIELGGAGGCFVSLGLAGQVLNGIEVVVWPKGNTVAELKPPETARNGCLVVTADADEHRGGVAELKVPLACERTGDKSTIHLILSNSRRVDSVALAENLIVDLDGDGQLAGFWLMDVPPFPDSGRAK